MTFNKELLTKKIGMTTYLNESGETISITVLQAFENNVISKNLIEKDGINILRVGLIKTEENKVNKVFGGQFKGLSSFFKKIVELNFKESVKYEIGQDIKVDLFSENEKINATGYTKGRGFAGTVKRYNFTIGPITHGSKHHRRNGSIGAGTGEGKVWKGKKMPGRYGNEKVTIKNLKIIKIDTEKNLILVKGAVPGSNGSTVRIYN